MSGIGDEITYDPLLSDYCWVYVQENRHNYYTVGISFEQDFVRKEQERGGKIILWRQFDDLLVASGYRLLLCRFSNKELRRAIRNYNKRQHRDK